MKKSLTQLTFAQMIFVFQYELDGVTLSLSILDMLSILYYFIFLCWHFSISSLHLK